MPIADVHTYSLSSYKFAMMGTLLTCFAAVGVLICINATNAADPIRDFVILPSALVGTDTTLQPFHPDFLAHMAGATIVNFGPWLKTEHQNTCVAWPAALSRS
jgi:hypothetical protein